MKTFSERNPYIIGGIGIAIVLGLVALLLSFHQLPFVSDTKEYSGYFAEAGGLKGGEGVQVSGLRVGEVSGIMLEGNRVLVKFKIDRNVRLGDRTEAAIKTRTVLGSKYLEVTPRGNGSLNQIIPLDRTISPYQLTDALGDLSKTIKGLNTDQLSNSLSTLAQTFQDTPPDLKIAVSGIERISQTLNNRDEQLRNLLANANKATKVLGERSDQIAGLITDANALLVELQTQDTALDQIAGNISALSHQLGGAIKENRDTLRPALDKLNGVLAIVNNRKDRVQKSIKLLNAYALGLGESVASGPFFKAYLVNLFPGQFVQPFIDAAFSDLGVDPNTLLPSERTDPQIGQPGTPALPVPYPRTGQGGEPNMTLPDAITGKPGDQGCGPPGLPLPGPTGCYPYREPLPAPPPGGPPPGPPALPAPGYASTPTPPLPIYQSAPGEAAPAGPAPGPTQPPAEGPR
jgi:phospholipid/cholesterol/gamma-HCH transport system substrate-binding protein